MPAFRRLLARYPVTSFYLVVFAVSWGGMAILASPGPIPGRPEDVERLFPLALMVLFAEQPVSWPSTCSRSRPSGY